MKIKISKYDKQFSDFVRSRAKWSCEKCGKFYPEGKRMAIHCSHFWGRGRWATRFDPENCAALCYFCHTYLGANPEEHRTWFLNRLGTKRYQALKRRANTPKPKAEAIKEFETWINK
jgi:hypothetical protein